MVHTIALEPGQYIVRRLREAPKDYGDFDKGVQTPTGVIYTDHRGDFWTIERSNSKVVFDFSCILFALFISTPFEKKIMVDHICHILDDALEEDSSMFDDF